MFEIPQTTVELSTYADKERGWFYFPHDQRRHKTLAEALYIAFFSIKEFKETQPNEMLRELYFQKLGAQLGKGVNLVIKVSKDYLPHENPHLPIVLACKKNERA